MKELLNKKILIVDDEKELLQMIGSIESKSTHPIGKAFSDYLTDNKLEVLTVDNFEDISGHGIIGNISSQEFILGNAKILTKYDIENHHIEDEKRLAKGRK